MKKKVKVLELENGFIWYKDLQVLTKDDEKVKLTEKEEWLLAFLVNQTGIVSFEDIKDYVWSKSRVLDDNLRFTLRNIIKQLRHKIYDDVIKNHSNIGYEFMGEVK